MNERKITRKERLCISECIQTYWGEPNSDTKDEIRNKKYEKCLTSCRICG